MPKRLLREIDVALWCVVILFAQPFAAEPRSQLGTGGLRISGRVVDSHGRVPSGITLIIGKEEGDSSFGSSPVQLTGDGSFATGPLGPATYVLQARPSAHSNEAGTRPEGGLTVVRLGSSDVAGVVLRTRPSFSVVGRFRMESDNPAAAWPPHIVVQARLALDGSGTLDSTVAEGAPAGMFIFRDVYGPRVVRCGYTLAAGSRWWPGRVLLDGVDITDVPTDFSEAQNGRLEVVFTQHPARFGGTVRDLGDRPVPEAWIVFFPAERARWQRWSAAAGVIRADFKGAFDFPMLPGRYLVRALPPTIFSAPPPSLRDFERLSQAAKSMELSGREHKILSLAIKPQ